MLVQGFPVRVHEIPEHQAIDPRDDEPHVARARKKIDESLARSLPGLNATVSARP